MQITYSCPKCHATVRSDFDDATRRLGCGVCGATVEVPLHAVEGDQVTKCLVCPSTELFIRKDFPQRLGVGIVVLGFLASSVAWYYHMVFTTYGILFLTALIDVGLFIWMGDLLECYRCHAQYRQVGNLKQHEPFDLEVHEKYRQQQARLRGMS